MVKSLKYKIHEWCADNFSGVQYPNVMPLTANAKLTKPTKPAHPIPFFYRLCIGISSLFALIVFGGLLAILLLLFWCFFIGPYV